MPHRCDRRAGANADGTTSGGAVGPSGPGEHLAMAASVGENECVRQGIIGQASTHGLTIDPKCQRHPAPEH